MFSKESGKEFREKVRASLREVRSEINDLKREVFGQPKDFHSYGFGIPIEIPEYKGLTNKIKDLEAEVLKLKDIVRELTDYVYSDAEEE